MIRFVVGLSAIVHLLLALGGALVALTPAHEPIWWPFAVWGTSFVIVTPLVCYLRRRNR